MSHPLKLPDASRDVKRHEWCMETTRFLQRDDMVFSVALNTRAESKVGRVESASTASRT
jgi:hypothetical protein